MKRIPVGAFIEQHVQTAPTTGYIFHAQLFPNIPAENMANERGPSYGVSPVEVAGDGLAITVSQSLPVAMRMLRVGASAPRCAARAYTIQWNSDMREQLIAACGKPSFLAQACLRSAEQGEAGPDIWSVRAADDGNAQVVGVVDFQREHCLGVRVYKGEAIPEYVLLFEAFWHGMYIRRARRIVQLPLQPLPTGRRLLPEHKHTRRDSYVVQG